MRKATCHTQSVISDGNNSSATCARCILLIFVDGLGMGSRNPKINPIYGGMCPHLVNLLDKSASPLDTSMGIAGIPQSATGQTALLTGLNAAAIIGRHVEAFPGIRLKRIIRQHNIFKQLARLGCKSTFANAYYLKNMTKIHKSGMQSVTTVATLSAFKTVRDGKTLENNESVYHDITRETLRQRGYNGPLVTPIEAARHLTAIALKHNFTLFEFFRTDRAGHRCDYDAAQLVLTELDSLVGETLRLCRQNRILFLLTSDHGNIEDLTVKRHTLNPVPLVAVGSGAAKFRRNIKSITDVTPGIVKYLAAGTQTDIRAHE
ncbi:MAG: peptidase [Lentisphaerae bacterium]|nr:peptidase [Lentisphaerota bacterium]